jgi:hypothetical protein
MSILAEEAHNVQNPALGSMLLWRFAVGYSASGTHNAVPMPLVFLVLPVLFHEETSEMLASTLAKSGLRMFVSKFEESSVSKNDLILALHDRAASMKTLSMDSMRLCLSSRLLVLDVKTGTIAATSITAPRAGIPTSLGPLLKSAEKLGAWFSNLSIHEIATTLKVNF